MNQRLVDHIRQLQFQASFRFDPDDVTQIHPFDDIYKDVGAFHEHMVTLYFMIKELKLKNILEIGVQGGDSTVAILYAINEIGGKLTSCDIKPCHTAHERVKQRNLKKRWKFIEQDSKKLDYIDELDMLFIDSEHSYTQVKAELERFEPLVKKGKYIVLHDYSTKRWEGLVKGVDEYFNDKKVERYRWLNGGCLLVVKKL